MNCSEARQYWHLHYDFEGEAELYLLIQEHLANCPSCADWFEKQDRIEDLLMQKIKDTEPTSPFWNRVLVGAGLTRPVRPRRRLALAAASAAAILVALGWISTRTAHPVDRDLIGLSSAWHDRLAMGSATVEFASRSDEEVDRYLRQKVSFPVRCPPRKDSGFEVRGAGTCRLANEPAAYVAGHVDRTPVSIFVMPSDSFAAFEAQRPREEGQLVRAHAGRNEVVLSFIDRNVVLVVGRAAPASLERVINAYGTYPDDL